LYAFTTQSEQSDEAHRGHLRNLGRVASPGDQTKDDTMAKQLTVVAFIRAKEGMENELGERILRLVPLSRDEPGCIDYNTHQDRDDPRQWVMYENWRDRADLDRHFTMPYHREFVAEFPRLVDSERAYFLDIKSKLS
jgi:quinol monooxygenase YgiN